MKLTRLQLINSNRLLQNLTRLEKVQENAFWKIIKIAKYVERVEKAFRKEMEQALINFSDKDEEGNPVMITRPAANGKPETKHYKLSPENELKKREFLDKYLTEEVELNISKISKKDFDAVTNLPAPDVFLALDWFIDLEVEEIVANEDTKTIQ